MTFLIVTGVFVAVSFTDIKDIEVLNFYVCLIRNEIYI